MGKVVKAKLQTKRTLFKQAEKKLGYSPLAAVTQQMIMNYNSNNNCGGSSRKAASGKNTKPEKYQYREIKFTDSDIQEITQTLTKERDLIKHEIEKRRPVTTESAHSYLKQTLAEEQLLESIIDL